MVGKSSSIFFVSVRIVSVSVQRTGDIPPDATSQVRAKEPRGGVQRCKEMQDNLTNLQGQLCLISVTGLAKKASFKHFFMAKNMLRATA